MSGKPRLNHKVAVSAKEKHKAALSAVAAASSFKGLCCCMRARGTLSPTARYPAWDQFCQLCIDRRLQCDHQMTAPAALTFGSITWHSVPFYGSSDRFTYSKGLKNSGMTWTDANLEKWLSDPDMMIPDNNMSFSVPRAEERRDLSAFLKQQSGAH